MQTLPFKLKNVFEGLAESEGMVSLVDNSLRLEFQTRDSVFGVIKSDVKEIKVSVDDIQDVQFKKGLFGDKIIIRASGMMTFKDFPNHKGGEIRLHLKKKDRHQAMMIVSDIQLAQAESSLRKIQEKGL
jgi:hypothetical protein